VSEVLAAAAAVYRQRGDDMKRPKRKKQQQFTLADLREMAKQLGATLHIDIVPIEFSDEPARSSDAVDPVAGIRES
jgi:hypothetical protein